MYFLHKGICIVLLLCYGVLLSKADTSNTTTPPYNYFVDIRVMSKNKTSVENIAGICTNINTANSSHPCAIEKQFEAIFDNGQLSLAGSDFELLQNNSFTDETGKVLNETNITAIECDETMCLFPRASTTYLDTWQPITKKEIKLLVPDIYPYQSLELKLFPQAIAQFGTNSVQCLRLLINENITIESLNGKSLLPNSHKDQMPQYDGTSYQYYYPQEPFLTENDSLKLLVSRLPQETQLSIIAQITTADDRCFLLTTTPTSTLTTTATTTSTTTPLPLTICKVQFGDPERFSADQKQITVTAKSPTCSTCYNWNISYTINPGNINGFNPSLYDACYNGCEAFHGSDNGARSPNIYEWMLNPSTNRRIWDTCPPGYSCETVYKKFYDSQADQTADQQATPTPASGGEVNSSMFCFNDYDVNNVASSNYIAFDSGKLDYTINVPNINPPSPFNCRQEGVHTNMCWRSHFESYGVCNGGTTTISHHIFTAYQCGKD